ncbi:TRAP transporter permease [Bacillus sp. Marseille-P3661]|uniref:TRAP transporter permease n=1 Tax=Bacillus sp. Marseille-P3661 TaxID=1936234 RepID=UPI000C860EF0|nr:TRAP transporter fused permease subunit [Bacillus sp. Marseille-P3661]
MEQTNLSRYRNLKGPMAVVLKVALAAIPVVGVLYLLGFQYKFGISIYEEQYIGLFIGLILFCIFLSVPISKRSTKSKVPWYDFVLAMLGLIVGLNVAINYPELSLTFTHLTPTRIALSVIAVLLFMEALRRLVGNILVVIVTIFIFYAWSAPFFPGPLSGKQIKPENLFNYLYLDASSTLNMFGLAATIALTFVLFGQVLLAFNGGDKINNIALSLFGRFRGGPAKASIVGSSAVGSVTGGPVTNVMITGTITIPMMKKNGYTSEQAGAIEAVASTGGQIMPPVMGIAAFVIADYMGVPYSEVALAALIPALLFYICLFAQVDFIAARDGFKRLSKDNLPAIKDSLIKGWLIVPPFSFLIYSLFFLGYPPTLAGIYATGIGLLFLTVFQRHLWKQFFKLITDAFVGTGRLLLEISIVLAAAGIIIGVTGVTGLGFNLALSLSYVGEYGLLPLLITSAIVAVILGMGMPSVAAYTLVAVLVAPALVELGVQPMAAHLFVFYFAILSNFTPPIALACFAASSIANASPNKIGLQAMRLGLVGYIVPFIFVFSPSLLLKGDIVYSTMILSVATAVVGCIILASAVEGFFLQQVDSGKRIVLGICGFLLLLPINFSNSTWIFNAVAVVTILYILFSQIRKSKSEKTVTMT